jgi:hypothetical protein
MTKNEKLVTNVLDTMLCARSVLTTCYHDDFVHLLNPARKEVLTEMIKALTIMIERVKQEQRHDNEQASS